MKPIRTTKSICPVCYRIIDAKLYEENGAVYMEKSCAEHGTFKKTYAGQIIACTNNLKRKTSKKQGKHYYL